MSKLYEIANEYAELANSGMDTDMIADTLDGIQDEFESKAENILAIIKNEQALEVALKAESKSLSERAKSCASRISNLKAYLASSMDTMEIKKINAGIHSISIRQGVKSVNILDVEKLPVDFVDYETIIKPNKNLIAEKIKLGEAVEGAELVTGKSTVIIK